MWKKGLCRGAVSLTICVTVNVIILMAKTMGAVSATGDGPIEREEAES